MDDDFKDFEDIPENEENFLGEPLSDGNPNPVELFSDILSKAAPYGMGREALLEQLSRMKVEEFVSLTQKDLKKFVNNWLLVSKEVEKEFGPFINPQNNEK